MVCGMRREFSACMIYLNSNVAKSMRWMGTSKSNSGEMVRDFLAGECDLMKLAGVHNAALRALQIFLDSAAGKPICVERSADGDLLVRAIGSPESLLLTGRTAEVACSYLDDAPARMEDRAEMTIRREIY
jgi:hypothetical protein